jgi:hypothetical protein
MVHSEDVDPLTVAREQLRVVLASGLQSLTVESRLHLGLLAAQITMAERLPVPAQAGWDPLRPMDKQFSWDAATVDLYLRNLEPTGLQLIQILVSEGGTATPDRIKLLTGKKSLAGMTSALRRATHRIASTRLPPPRLVQVDRQRHTDKALRYRLSEETLPIVAATLERICSASDVGEE